MVLVTLVHPEVMLTVPHRQAMAKCSLFGNNPAHLGSPYRVQSQVIFRDFVAEFEGNAVTITNTNFRGLERLWKEFALVDFTAKLSSFQPSIGFEDAEARRRIAALEEKAKQHTPARLRSRSSRQTLDDWQRKSQRSEAMFRI
jgi:hypothetical protein